MFRSMDPEPHAFVRRLGNLIRMIRCFFWARHDWHVVESWYHDSSSDLDYSCQRCGRSLTTYRWRVTRIHGGVAELDNAPVSKTVVAERL